MKVRSVVIRKSTPEDARGIAHVQVEGWRSAYADIIESDYLKSLSVDHRAEVWGKILVDPGATTWVAVDQNQIVGFCGVGSLRPTASITELDFKKTGEIYAIYILPVYQRKGLGGRFFDCSREYFHANGMTQFVVWVLKDNAHAQLFYQHQRGRPFAKEIRPVAGKDYLEVCYIFANEFLDL